MRTNGRRYRQLTSAPNLDDSYPAYSPDGRTIVFLRSNAGDTDTQVRVADRRGRPQRQLTFDPGLKGQLPDWLVNPDGTG